MNEEGTRWCFQTAAQALQDCSQIMDALCITNLSCQNAASQSTRTHTHKMWNSMTLAPLNVSFPGLLINLGPIFRNFHTQFCTFQPFLGGGELIGSLRSLGFLFPKKNPALSRRSSYRTPTVFRGPRNGAVRERWGTSWVNWSRPFEVRQKLGAKLEVRPTIVVLSQERTHMNPPGKI